MIPSPAAARAGSEVVAVARTSAGVARLPAIVVACALLAYGLLAFGYLSLTPIWQNPDEPAHYNYVAFVAQTGGLPVLQAGDWDSALLERLKNGTLQPGDSIEAIRYESWQPPLFYLVAAPVFRLGPSDPQAAVFRLRALDALFGAATLLVAYHVARAALPSALAAAVPATMVGVPMFTAVSAALSADPLANLIAALAVLLLVQRMRQARAYAPRWAGLLGALVGLGLLTKLALAIFVPIVLLVIALRSSRRWAELISFGVVAAALVSPWLAHQVTTYGWTDPLALARHSAVVADQPRFPGLSQQYVADFLTISFHSFWAQFGWMAVVASPRLYWTWGVLVLIAGLGLALNRRWLIQPASLVLVATIGAACLAYLGYNATFEQAQGRYLFTALVPVALLLVAGWAGVLPRRSQPWSVLVVTAALIGLNAYALARVLMPGFAPNG